MIEATPFPRDPAAEGVLPPEVPRQEEPAEPGTRAAAGSEPAAAEGEAASSARPPLVQLSREELGGALEAVLFSAGEPIPLRQLAELFQRSLHDVREAVEDLRLEYVNSRRAFRLEEVAGGVQLLTLARHDPWVRRYLSRARESRLSAAAFETLAVIAYKQPINKADLEAIRGVQCGPILKTLLDRNLVKVVGREDTLGKPLLYGTTRRFLESFGLPSISGLPQPDLDAAAAFARPDEGAPPGAPEDGAQLEGVPPPMPPEGTNSPES